MDCKICHTSTHKIFSKTILKSYDATYYKCPHCDFIQTSEALWLREAYASAITHLDIGLLNRNIRLLQEVPPIIDACFPKADIFLDYAGGYGAFARLMRDEGFNFYRQDIYCENIFAQHFDLADSGHSTFDVLTAFEVFEHFTDPANEIAALFTLSENIIFSTVQHEEAGNDLENWWYLSTETGQHVAFYGKKTFDYLAKKHGKHYYSKSNSLHLFTSVPLTQDQIDYAFRDVRVKSQLFGLKKQPLDFKIRRTSLLQSDYERIKSIIKGKSS